MDFFRKLLTIMSRSKVRVTEINVFYGPQTSKGPLGYNEFSTQESALEFAASLGDLFRTWTVTWQTKMSELEVRKNLPSNDSFIVGKCVNGVRAYMCSASDLTKLLTYLNGA